MSSNRFTQLLVARLAELNDGGMRKRVFDGEKGVQQEYESFFQTITENIQAIDLSHHSIKFVQKQFHLLAKQFLQYVLTDATFMQALNEKLHYITDFTQAYISRGIAEWGKMNGVNAAKTVWVLLQINQRSWQEFDVVKNDFIFKPANEIVTAIMEDVKKERMNVDGSNALFISNAFLCTHIELFSIYLRLSWLVDQLEKVIKELSTLNDTDPSLAKLNDNLLGLNNMLDNITSGDINDFSEQEWSTEEVKNNLHKEIKKLIDEETHLFKNIKEALKRIDVDNIKKNTKPELKKQKSLSSLGKHKINLVAISSSSSSHEDSVISLSGSLSPRGSAIETKADNMRLFRNKLKINGDLGLSPRGINNNHSKTKRADISPRKNSLRTPQSDAIKEEFEKKYASHKVGIGGLFHVTTVNTDDSIKIKIQKIVNQIRLYKPQLIELPEIRESQSKKMTRPRSRTITAISPGK